MSSHQRTEQSSTAIIETLSGYKTIYAYALIESFSLYGPQLCKNLSIFNCRIYTNSTTCKKVHIIEEVCNYFLIGTRCRDLICKKVHLNPERLQKVLGTSIPYQNYCFSHYDHTNIDKKHEMEFLNKNQIFKREIDQLLN